MRRRCLLVGCLCWLLAFGGALGAAGGLAHAAVRLAGAHRPRVRLSVELLAGGVLRARGSIHPVLSSVHVSVEVRRQKGRSGRVRWIALGRDVRVSAHGTFALLRRLSRKPKTVVVRPELLRGRHMLFVGAPRKVRLSAKSVLGGQTIQPGPAPPAAAGALRITCASNGRMRRSRAGSTGHHARTSW
jgi:hypothetical protein